MKHTGAKPLAWPGLALLGGLLQGPAPLPAQEPQLPTVGELLQKVQAREKTLKSVEIEFSVRDRFPNNVRFESRGTLRVLRGTHFQTVVQVAFDDEVRSEMQTVVTPEGVWTCRKDPIEEIYLFMSPELRKEMEAKTRRLGEDAGLPGPLSGPKGGVLGGAMLKALSQQFDLKVTGQKKIDGVRCWVLAGARRQPKTGEEKRNSPLEQPAPEKAEVVLRDPDAIPIRMTQFGADGTPMLSFQVHKLAVDAKLDPTTFKVDKPEGATFIDIQKHPPSWAQILRVREAYAELVEKEKDRPASEPASKPASKPTDTRKDPDK
jgi:outer membrane lipoprotein-sorting protein